MDTRETVDRLIGTWSIVQLAKGHRFSTDDLVTAWRASLAKPEATRLLDMGSGVGSVGLSTLYRMGPHATLTTIEAQAISTALARKSVRLNGLEDRVTVLDGDLRDPSVLAEGQCFDLITGSPPYIPLGSGLLSPHPQRAACRIELRGSVFDYCEAAKRWLAPGGRFAFVMLAADPRTEAAPIEAGLTVVERWEYVFGANRDPHVATLVCGHAEESLPERVTGRLVIRGADGEWTPDYDAFRRDMGVIQPAQGAEDTTSA
ncbi:MAG: methyltransferase [Myxococcota bacterium]